MNLIPAHDLDAETNLLGAMLVYVPAVEWAIEEIALDPGDFYLDRHQAIYAGMLELHLHGRSLDSITVTDELRRQGKLDEAGGQEYVFGLAEKVEAAGNASSFARIVSEKATLRRMLATSYEIQEVIDAPGLSLEERIDQAEKAPNRIRADRPGEGRPTASGDSVMESLAQLEQRAAGNIPVSAITTGLDGIDRQLGAAVGPAAMIVVAARPATGKSLFAAQVSYAMARREKEDAGRVLFFSMEMTKREITDRMLVSLSGVDASRFGEGQLTDEETNGVLEAARRQHEWQDRLWIDDRAHQTMARIRTAARRQKQAGGLSLIVVDYLQLIRPVTKPGFQSNRQQEVAEIARDLKVLAGELSVPVLAVSQLSRASENRPDKRPQLSDLRESGEIEQAADIVVLMQAGESGGGADDFYSSQQQDDQGAVTHFHFDKVRNGRTGSVTLPFDKRSVRFLDLATRVL